MSRTFAPWRASVWVIGLLTEITYANGGKVEVTYNGQYGQPGKLKVTKVTGPMGYETDYTYAETEIQGQAKQNVTFVKKDSLAQETTFALTDNQTKKKVTDALGNWTENVDDANGHQKTATIAPTMPTDLQEASRQAS